VDVKTKEDYDSWHGRLSSVGITDDFNQGVPDTAALYSVPVHSQSLAKFQQMVPGATPSLTPKTMPDHDVFPHDTVHFPWNRDNFGPLVIPKEGMTVHLSLDSLALWHRIISVYEGNKLEIKGGQIFINGKPETTYTFKQDYFWLMGDNRHNSLDSRYWGFVPADHVVGKPVFVWMSKGETDGLRTNRMMSFVSKDGLSKSYLWWVIGGIVLFVVYNQFKNRGKGKDKDKGNEPPKLKVQTKKK
jgi:signal peptidase I